jgi:L-aspartate oxidase
MSPAQAVIRYLPRTRLSFERHADVVVVGAGAAGLSAALAAASRGRRVLLVTKDDPRAGSASGCTPLAQGGLAAAVGPGDGAALHERDTIRAGAGLSEPAAVAALVASAPAEISRLARLGARLSTDPLHREGGHSRSRIVTAGGDAIGAEVHRALRAALAASPVEVLSRSVAIDVLTGEPDSAGQAGTGGWASGNRSPGARSAVAGLLLGIDDGDGQPLRQGLVTARAVVIATGGFGQAFATTSNPGGVTGDGLALAARAGAELQDVEFVQFHPTVLWLDAPSGRRPLITEALRGAGAVLVDQAGRPVMAGRHPLGDLAPRDVVSAAMQQRMEEGDGPRDHLWLDATVVGRVVLERDFPTVTAICRTLGIDPASEPIPVAPGAHYACGGIRADMDGRTGVPGLYAVGEAASTGVHGANRLGSNSLTEALIAGRRVGDLLGQLVPASLPAEALAESLPQQCPPGSVPRGAQPAARDDLGLPPAGAGVHSAARPALAAAMSRYAGVLRDRDGLERLLAQLGQAPPGAAGDGLDLVTFEATSLHTVSVLVAAAALARAESRGSHRWRDMPAVSGGLARHSVLRAADGEVRVGGSGVTPTRDAVSAGVEGSAA